MVDVMNGPEAHESTPIERTRLGLERAREGSDEARLAVLDELYRSLEAELERDLDQAGSSRF